MGELGRTRPTATLAVLALSGLSFAALSSVILPALPTLQHELRASESQAAWLLTGYLLASSVATGIIGRLGDLYGKERLLLITLLILAGGALLGAVSTSLAPMIAARFVQGVGGGIFPLAFGIVRDEFPPAKVPGGIGLLSGVIGVGAGIGVVCSGLIVEHLNYHWLFWIPLAAVVLAAIATWLVVPESPLRAPGRVNWLNALLMTMGFSALLLGVSEAVDWGWASTRVDGLFVVGLAFVAAWIVAEARSEEPLVDMRMMRRRSVWSANAAAFLLGAGLYTAFVVIPQFAQLPRSAGIGFGSSVVVSGLFLLPTTIGMTVLGLASGKIARRFGSRLALVVGSLLAAASFVSLLFVHQNPRGLLVGATSLGVGIGLAFSSLGNLIVTAVPPSQTGVATGINTVMRTFGGALGGQLAAALIADNLRGDTPTATGFHEVFLVTAGFLALCAVAASLSPATRPAGGAVLNRTDGLP